MKEKELRENSDCAFCGEKIGKGGIFFWRVTVEKFGLDLAACNRQQGLGMMMGGHGGLAMVMGPDEELAKPMMKPVTLTVCQPCSMKPKAVEVFPEYRKKPPKRKK